MANLESILELILESTLESILESVLELILESILESRFQEKSFFLCPPCLPPHVNPSLREWISFGGKRSSANPAGVAVYPFGS